MRRALLSFLAVSGLVAGCGGGTDKTVVTQPVLGKPATAPHAAEQLGFPGFATKNTTRVGGADPIADAAGVAQAVFPSGSPGSRPGAVVLAPSGAWQPALAASVLAAAPLHAPTLLAQGPDLPAASADALRSLAPAGAPAAGGAQILRVADAPAPPKLKNARVAPAGDPAAVAEAVDRFQAAAAGKTSSAVLVVSQDAPAYAVPAAGWAAKSGDPILFVTRTGVPGPTQVALKRHGKPQIFVLGPEPVVSAAVLKQLGSFGKVTRVAGADPIANSIAFARCCAQGPSVWHIVDPGHGLVFASAARPLDAAVAAPLSASGSYGPLVLVDRAAPLPPAVEGYLLDIQPGYSKDPARGVYNHGWLIGDDKAISLAAQSRIDGLLEIAQVKSSTTP